MTAPLEVGLCCADLDRLSKFYVDVLRCRRISVFDVPSERAQQARLSDLGYRVLRLQTPWGERIKLLEPHKPPSGDGPADWILARRNAAYLTFIVRDLRLMLRRLKSSAATIMTGDEPIEVRPGVWLVFATDPEGNVLEFVQYEDVASYRPDLAAVRNTGAADAEAHAAEGPNGAP
jgi:predicted enzyme related to lactoylglutathione lyase